jgi:glycosyltransferase involved in cell wall biosynthesis
MPPYEHAFTVFTATYNRAHTLHRVFDSLQRQTFRDFEWLIVDDGSVDGTRALVEQWRSGAPFPIRYVWQENQGKHVAFNHGVRLANGALFAPLDSDDACVPEALERLHAHWMAIPEAGRSRFAGLSCVCLDQHGHRVGRGLPRAIIDADMLEMRYRYGIHDEQWGVYRTDVLMQYPFPESVTRQYIPEGLVWSRLARAFKVRFINEALRIYHVDAPSMVHGGQPGRNAVGARLYYLMVLNDELDFFRHAPLQFCRSAALYARASFHLRRTIHQQAGDIRTGAGRLLWALVLPIGFGVYAWETLWRGRGRSGGRH